MKAKKSKIECSVETIMVRPRSHGLVSKSMC